METSSRFAKGTDSGHVTRSPRQPARQEARSGWHAKILAMQRAVGNRVVSELLQSVASSQAPAAPVARSARGGRDALAGVTAVSGVREVLRSPGHELGTDTRAFMEQRFGHDFSRVRVHTDSQAAASARAAGAKAYTVAEDVVFDQGHYAPATRTGRRLIAHELAHVVQQSRGGAGANAESRARAAAAQVERGEPLSSELIGGAPVGIQTVKSETEDTDEAGAPAAIGTKNRVGVFAGFEHNRFELPSAHAAAINALVVKLRAELSAAPRGSITIVGHTDTSGEDAYNRLLGLQRAMALRQELAKRGVPAHRIQAPKSLGESQPAIATGNGVKSPENRRVEVFFDSSPDLDEIVPPLRSAQQDVPAPPLAIPVPKKPDTQPGVPAPKQEHDETIEFKVTGVPIQILREKAHEAGREKKETIIAQKVEAELTIKSQALAKFPNRAFELRFVNIEASYALALKGDRKPGERQLQVKAEGELGVAFTLVEIKLTNAVLALPAGTKLSVKLSFLGGATAGLGHQEFKAEQFKIKAEGEIEVPLGKAIGIQIKIEAVPGSGGGISVGVPFDITDLLKKKKK